MDIIPVLVPSFGVLQIVIRTAVIYVFIVAAIRFFGKREIAQLSITDLVLILLIANSVQTAMVGVDVSLWGGITAAITLFAVNYIFGKLFYKSKTLTGIIQGRPVMLVYEGHIIDENLKKVQITNAELEAVVREHGVEHVANVNLAILEVDGNISVLSNNFTKRTKRSHPHKAVSKIE